MVIEGGSIFFFNNNKCKISQKIQPGNEENKTLSNNNIWLGSVSKDSEEGSGSFDIFTDFLVDKIMMFRLFGV